MNRKLDDGEKIQVLSTAEIKDVLAAIGTRLSRRVKFQGRKLRPSPMINALVLWYADQSSERQEEIARAYVAKLEAILESDTPVELKSEADDAERPIPSVVPAVDDRIRGIGSVDMTPRRAKVKRK